MATVRPLDAYRHYGVYAAAVTLGMTATVGGALAFQYIGGYIPCALCLLQRDPYYYGIPVGVAATLAAMCRLPAWIVRGLLAVIGIMMLVGAGMGALSSRKSGRNFCLIVFALACVRLMLGGGVI